MKPILTKPNPTHPNLINKQKVTVTETSFKFDGVPHFGLINFVRKFFPKGDFDILSNALLASASLVNVAKNPPLSPSHFTWNNKIKQLG